MDNAKPIDVVLHLNVVTPYDERTDRGWSLDLLEDEIRAALSGLWRNAQDAELDSIEIIEQAPDTSGYEAPYSDGPSDTSYRQHMTDAGRGGLLR